MDAQANVLPLFFVVDSDPADGLVARRLRAPVTPAGLGKDALLYLNVAVTLDGKRLTSQEIRRLLAGIDGLALIRGLRVELDREGLERGLGRFRAASYVTVTAALK